MRVQLPVRFSSALSSAPCESPLSREGTLKQVVITTGQLFNASARSRALLVA
ncbi:hypothetical protein KCP75_02880 [Salmonella enterica subsp. enterica]|nr:hypothetical protein KCP75_02880 [Salmonella enterica subsp. enterica]